MRLSRRIFWRDFFFFLIIMILSMRVFWRDFFFNHMFQETVNEIVKASVLPLSIVIVGVGAADFSNMDILDADDEPLRCVKLFIFF